VKEEWGLGVGWGEQKTRWRCLGLPRRCLIECYEHEIVGWHFAERRASLGRSPPPGVQRDGSESELRS
jgi:hypothetical protein